MSIRENRIRRVKWMTRSELLYELRSLGWYDEYKDYSDEAIRRKLINRLEYFGGF